MDNNTTLTFEEKLNYLLRRHYNLFHCDMILEALYNEEVNEQEFDLGLHQIECAERNDVDEYVPKSFKRE